MQGHNPLINSGTHSLLGGQELRRKKTARPSPLSPGYKLDIFGVVRRTYYTLCPTVYPTSGDSFVKLYTLIGERIPHTKTKDLRDVNIRCFVNASPSQCISRLFQVAELIIAARTSVTLTGLMTYPKTDNLKTGLD